LSLSEPIDAQIRRQHVDRQAFEDARHQAQVELQGWPALRDRVRERVLPALRTWHADLAPYTRTAPRARFVRATRRLATRLRTLRWRHPGAWRLRRQIAMLWLALNWPIVLQGLAALLVVVLIVLAVIYRQQIGDLIQNLFGGL
jgi:hypothetical protein